MESIILLNKPENRSCGEIIVCALNEHALLSFHQEQREREKQDLELAKEMAEDDDDFP